MHKRAATLAVVLMVAWVFSGCMKHAPLPTAQDTTPGGGEASISEYIRSILRISSENSPVNDQAVAELHKRRPELADLAQHVANDPSDRRAIRTLAQAYFHEKLYLKAYDLYQQVQFAAPEDSQACLGLAQIWEVWGDKDLALLYATRAAALDPGSSEALAVSGRIRLQRKELDAALDAFRASLQISPDNAYVQAGAGYIYMLQDDWESARKHLQHAVDLDPAVPETRNNLGVVLARLGDSEGAIRAFMVSGDAAVAHNNLGAAYLALHDWKGAQAQFRLALAINPEYAKAALNLKEAESHLPLPAVYAVQPFPAVKPVLGERDWQRPVETAHSHFQPPVPVSLSGYIRSVFRLQESVAGPGQMAVFPSPEPVGTGSVFSRYAQIPARTAGRGVSTGEEGEASAISPPSEGYAPRSPTTRQAPAGPSGFQEPSPKPTKPVSPAPPAMVDPRPAGGKSTSRTSGNRLGPAQGARATAFMAARQEFRPIARLSISDYIHEVFRLQQDAFRTPSHGSVARPVTHQNWTRTAVFRAANVSERILFIASTRSLPVPRFAGSSSGSDAIFEAGEPDDRRAAGKVFASLGSGRIVPYTSSSNPALRQAVRPELTSAEKNQAPKVSPAQKGGVADPWALARKGQLLLKQRQWEQARQILEQVTQVDASVPGARENLGLALVRLGDREKALSIFLRLGRPAEAFYRLGVIFLSEKKWPEARSEFVRALDLEPDFAEALNGLRDAEFHLGSPPSLAKRISAVRNDSDARAAGAMFEQKTAAAPVIERACSENIVVWYRVGIGGYQNTSAALETATRILLDKLIRKFWIAPTDN